MGSRRKLVLAPIKNVEELSTDRIICFLQKAKFATRAPRLNYRAKVLNLVKTSTAIILLSSSLILSACGGSIEDWLRPSGLVGAPQVPGNVDSEINALTQLTGQRVIDNYLAREDSARNGLSRQRYRNLVVSARLHLTDIYYQRFVQALYAQRRSRNVLLESLGLGLTAAASVVGGQATIQALSATATGVGGLNATLDAELYYDQTLPAIIAQMEAGRQQAKARILQGIQRPDEQYTLFTALSDLDDYYRSGSLIGAIAGITQESGVALNNATDQIEAIYQTEEFAPSPNQRPLRNQLITLAQSLPDVRALELANAPPALGNDQGRYNIAVALNPGFQSNPTAARGLIVTLLNTLSLSDQELELWREALE